MDPQTMYQSGDTAKMAYSHCKTRVIDLRSLQIPDIATEAEYKQFYDQLSQSKTPTARALTEAVNSISIGIAPPVAFPTETVYGLGADATNRASIAGIFAAKGRPSDNPLIVHVASKEHLERLTGEPIPSVYTDLIKEHWPGPLTILVPVPEKQSPFASNVHPGQKTIGFRVPSSKFARFFIAATDRPIAAPSANSSGKPSPTTAQHVMDDLKGKINFILDGGSCDVGVESTVVDGLRDPPLILRPGGLSQDDLIAHGKKFGNVWANVKIGYKTAHEEPDVNVTNAVTEDAPRAPGMKYKHYAPQGRMILFESKASFEQVRAELDALIDTVSPSTNGCHDPEYNKSSEPPNIAILTTTSWSNFAKRLTSNPETHSLTNGSSTTSTSPSPSSPLPSLSPTSTINYRQHKIHSLSLGSSPQQIAQSLFAALRSCDDLKCRFILAEAPQRYDLTLPNGEEGDGQLMHQFDAVLERMRKAASLVVT